MQVFGLLCITHVYSKPECIPMKDTKCLHVLMQTSAVRANHDAHGSILMSCVYMHALNIHFYIIGLSCTRRLCCEYFKNRVDLCSYLTRV